MSRALAVLGGSKEFPEGVPFNQPTIPAWEDISPEFEAVYRSGWLTKGPCLQQFEEEAAAYLGVRHVIGTASCTSGLILAIQALQLPEGAEVIVPSFSFMATFHALYWNRLKPVFADIEPHTFSVDAEAVRRAVTPRTAAVMAASTFGNPPDWAALEALAAETGLPVFADSAHGLGTIYNGRRLGGYGAFEVFSLSPTKLLTAGEGGLVATNRDDIAAWVRAGRDYGNPGSYDCPHVGLNARMSEFHAILGRRSLPLLDGCARHRNEAAAAYRKSLAGIPGTSFQTIREGARSSYKDFAVLIDSKDFGLSRDTVIKALAAEGVPTRAYFHPAGHQLTPYRSAAHGDLSVTERVSSQVVCLPISSHIPLELAERIGGLVGRIYEQRADLRALEQS